MNLRSGSYLSHQRVALTHRPTGVLPRTVLIGYLFYLAVCYFFAEVLLLYVC
jgi:hypothetical protein